MPERRYTATRATSSCIEKSCSGGCLKFLGCGIRAKAQVAQPRFELAVGPSAIAAPRIALRVRRVRCRAGRKFVPHGALVGIDCGSDSQAGARRLMTRMLLAVAAPLGIRATAFAEPTQAVRSS